MRKNINVVRPVSATPQRTCVTCRRVKSKRELVRLVRTASGDVEIDIIGRKNGRGAYLCRSWECWETAFKSGRLEHSLKTDIDHGQRDGLVKAAETLLPDD